MPEPGTAPLLAVGLVRLAARRWAKTASRAVKKALAGKCFDDRRSIHPCALDRFGCKIKEA